MRERDIMAGLLKTHPVIIREFQRQCTPAETNALDVLLIEQSMPTASFEQSIAPGTKGFGKIASLLSKAAGRNPFIAKAKGLGIISENGGRVYLSEEMASFLRESAEVLQEKIRQGKSIPLLDAY